MRENLNEQYSSFAKHLKEMQEMTRRNDRVNAIEQKTLSEISSIIQEIQNAIIEKVKNAIPTNYDGQIVFILGATGSGKSTTLCYLRGDTMLLSLDKYESKEDTAGYISHSSTDSQTLLPNIELLDNMVFVDFGGFFDSKGPLIDLATEHALITLTQEFNPKILVLESILNTERRMGNSAQLGSLLKRVFENKEQICTLGLTKYTQSEKMIGIKGIEQEQMEFLQNPSVEEKNILAQAEALEKILKKNLPDGVKVQLQSKLEQIQESLLKIRQETKAGTSQPIMELSQKKLERQQNIQRIEAEFLEQIGLTELIRLDDLNDPNKRKQILEQLSTPSPKPVLNPHLELDCGHEELIRHCFKEEFIKNKKPQDNRKFQHFNSFAECRQLINEHSLLYVIANQDIADFLHLAQMNPKLIRSLDFALIENTIDNLKQSIVGLGCPQFTQSLASQYDVASESLRKALTNLETYIKSQQGYVSNKPEKQEIMDIKWNNYLKYNYSSDFKKEYHLADWVKIATCIDVQSFEAIYDLRTKLFNKKPICKDELNNATTIITNVHNTLALLFEVKGIVSSKHVVRDKQSPVFEEQSLVFIEHQLEESSDNKTIVTEPEVKQVNNNSFFSTQECKNVATQPMIEQENTLVNRRAFSIIEDYKDNTTQHEEEQKNTQAENYGFFITPINNTNNTDKPKDENCIIS